MNQGVSEFWSGVGTGVAATVAVQVVVAVALGLFLKWLLPKPAKTEEACWRCGGQPGVPPKVYAAAKEIAEYGELLAVSSGRAIRVLRKHFGIKGVLSVDEAKEKAAAERR